MSEVDQRIAQVEVIAELRKDFNQLARIVQGVTKESKRLTHVVTELSNLVYAMEKVVMLNLQMTNPMLARDFQEKLAEATRSVIDGSKP